ncbi:M20/M25/M40 family metallo-hydrolase [bacterium]|nr:M20/M25/M40 family metallo-hydrolase [bacterium]
MTNKKRLVDNFIKLVKIDSESFEEANVAAELKKELEKFGGKVSMDNAGEKIKGNCGNMVARFDGDLDSEMILLTCHMDTVKPGKGIKPVIEGDIIKSDGTTVLGSDDKSGIAAILEAIQCLKESKTPHRPFEVVFTVAEEQGVLGSSYLDSSLIKSKMGFALDDHEVGGFTVSAPAKASVNVLVHGLEAHAGVEPQNGISAIKCAANAISRMKLGRIDDATTANVGTFVAQFATNVVPNMVEIKSEARSLYMDRLDAQIEHMKKCYIDAAKEMKIVVDGQTKEAIVDIKVDLSYSSFIVDEKDKVYQLAKKATEKMGLTPKFNEGLGGSDANHFNKHGIKVIMMGTGMDKVHTKAEHIKISEMVKCADLLQIILTMGE